MVSLILMDQSIEQVVVAECHRGGPPSYGAPL